MGELEYSDSEKYKQKVKEGTDEWQESFFKDSNVDDLAKIGLERKYFGNN